MRVQTVGREGEDLLTPGFDPLYQTKLYVGHTAAIPAFRRMRNSRLPGTTVLALIPALKRQKTDGSL